MSNHFDSIRKLMDSSANKKAAQNEQETMQINKQNYYAHKNALYDYFNRDYQVFASHLKRCLESNYANLGVSCPRHVEELYYHDEFERIDGTILSNGGYQNITFSFETKRAPKELTTGTSEYVPVDEIERLLPGELAKYISPYRFTELEVIELPDRKAKIIVRGIDRPQPQIQQMPYGPYGGYY